jgi:hypothetical protein
MHRIRTARRVRDDFIACADRRPATQFDTFLDVVVVSSFLGDFP